MKNILQLIMEEFASKKICKQYDTPECSGLVTCKPKQGCSCPHKPIVQEG